MKEVKPRQFCCVEATMDYRFEDDQSGFVVYCQKCGVHWYYCDDADEAVAKLNTRAEEPKEQR